jgi:sulfite reductase alpha subunit-like flavoprotein
VFVSNPLSSNKGAAKHPFPSPISIGDALQNFVDLRGPIRKKMLKDLSNFCSNPEEKMK